MKNKQGKDKLMIVVFVINKQNNVILGNQEWMSLLKRKEKPIKFAKGKKELYSSYKVLEQCCNSTEVIKNPKPKREEK